MKYQVEIREYERGWGSRIENIKEFDTEQEALAFIEDYNKENNLPEAPDIYWMAFKKNF